MDKKEIEHEAAIRANKDYGNTEDGRKHLSSNLGEITLTNYKKNIENENKISIDHLTHLFKREKYESELKSLSRKNLNFSVLFLDIDEFKKINDRYKHGGGDAALIHISRLLVNNLKIALPENKNSDLVARYGGDEFAIILKNVNDREILLSIAERLKKSVENTKFQIRGEQVGLSISVGAGIKANKEKWNTFQERVDNALYESKKKGKNMVTFSEK